MRAIVRGTVAPLEAEAGGEALASAAEDAFPSGETSGGTREAGGPEPAEDGEAEDDPMDEDEAAEAEEGSEPAAEERELSPEEMRLVEKVHVDVGHPTRDEYLRLLRCAHARPEVISYVKKRFRCGQCESSVRMKARRRAAVPRTYAFNKIVGAGLVYLPFQGEQRAFLNLVCHGSNLQLLLLVGAEGRTHTAEEAWSTYSKWPCCQGATSP